MKNTIKQKQKFNWNFIFQERNKRWKQQQQNMFSYACNFNIHINSCKWHCNLFFSSITFLIYAINFKCMFYSRNEKKNTHTLHRLFRKCFTVRFYLIIEFMKINEIFECMTAVAVAVAVTVMFFSSSSILRFTSVFSSLIVSSNFFIFFFLRFFMSLVLRINAISTQFRFRILYIYVCVLCALK